MTEIYSLAGWRPEDQNQGVGWAPLPLKALGEGPASPRPASAYGRQTILVIPLASGPIPSGSASSPSCLSVCLSVFFTWLSCEDTSA